MAQEQHTNCAPEKQPAVHRQALNETEEREDSKIASAAPSVGRVENIRRLERTETPANRTALALQRHSYREQAREALIDRAASQAAAQTVSHTGPLSSTAGRHTFARPPPGAAGGTGATAGGRRLAMCRGVGKLRDREDLCSKGQDADIPVKDELITTLTRQLPTFATRDAKGRKKLSDLSEK